MNDRTLTSVLDTEREVAVSTFAAFLGEEIASQRGVSSIADTFALLMSEHVVGMDQSRDQLAVWANSVSTLILSDTEYDEESLMAKRATSTVILENIGSTVTIASAAGFAGERVTVQGEQFILSGMLCPCCGVNPECQGGWDNTPHCLDRANCGWADVPF
jgi:hypothetical protein